MKEEVGLTVEVVRRLGERVHPATGRHLVYLVRRVLAGESSVVDHDEVAAIEWCDLPTVLMRWAGLKGGIYPAVREYLEQALGTASLPPPPVSAALLSRLLSRRPGTASAPDPISASAELATSASAAWCSAAWSSINSGA